MDRPDWLADPRFSTRTGREENASELEDEISKWFARPHD